MALPAPYLLTATARRTPRWWALRLALVAALAVFALQLARLSDPVRTPPDDFISSWAAGRLWAAGANPYDGAQVLAVQRTAHWTKDIPYRVWYPPWTMPLLGAFGVLPYATGRFLWYLLNVAACVASAELLWRHYGGPSHARPLVWPLLVTFAPAVVAIRTGQISALVLLGVAGFLAGASHRRWLLAGACLPLVAIKPQLLHLFWIGLLFWMVRERRWQVLLGAAAATLALTAVATAVDPAVVAQFLTMAGTEAPRAPASTLGTVLRFASVAATGADRFWLQFVPPALSLLWFVPFAQRRRIGDDWRADGSVLVVGSLVTTAYGWIYDDSALLVPVIQIAAAAASAAQPRTYAVAGIAYLAINAAIFTMNVAGADAFWYIWVPFAFAAWWWGARWRS